MKNIARRTFIVLIMAIVAVILNACSGGNSRSTGSSDLSTLSGIVSDPTGTFATPVPGATVTLRDTGNSALSSTITGTNGLYTFANFPRGTDIYIDASKTGYANCNTEILNLTTGVSKDIVLIPATSAQDAADAFTESAGGTSWSDAFYAGKSWFAIDVEDENFLSVSGLAVASTPIPAVIKYNDGSDKYTSKAPTVSSADAPLVAGYGSSSGIYLFTMTSGTNSQSVKLPLVPGEITYIDVQQ